MGARRRLGSSGSLIAPATALLFVGHDQGAAVMLAPVIERLQSAGAAIELARAGPAASVWEGFDAPTTLVREDGGDTQWWERFLADRNPMLVVTGTGHFSDLERNCWVAANRRGIRTLAAIDAWVNFAERFVRTSDGQFVQPDALCVIDEACRSRLAKETRLSARIHVVGHPHLEKLSLAFAASDARPRGKDAPRVVFFSNPVLRSGASDRGGGDQFDAASALVRALAAVGPVNLQVKPHPRESQIAWEAWRAALDKSEQVDVALVDRASQDLMAQCDAVVGITTMALVEAALLGLPAMSLQFDSNRPGYQHNEAIDATGGISVIREVPALVAAVRNLFGADRLAETAPGLRESLFQSALRFERAIETEITHACR